MEINHFSHEHPLVLSEEKFNAFFLCSICSHSVFGQSYCCLVCRYVVHYGCANLPLMLSVPDLHKKHGLILHAPHPTGPVECNACGYKINGFVYTCTTGCLFNLHVYCALYRNPITLEAATHDEDGEEIPLKLTLYVPGDDEVRDPCLICAYDIKGPVLTAGYELNQDCHFQCAMLPRLLKHEIHRHELSLCPPPFGERDKYLEFFCDACEQERDPDSFVYGCKSCQLQTHIGCGISGSERPIQDVLGTFPVYKLSDDEIAKENKKKDKYWGPETYNFGDYYEDAELQEAEGDLVEHFCHRHPLTVVNYSVAINVNCSICFSKISGTTYECKECYFLIHRRCAKLPDEIHHWMHPHHGALKLLQEYDFLCSEIPQEGHPSCDFCHKSGLSTDPAFYGCDKCTFKLDLICALLPNTNNLNHPSHEHALTAVDLWPRGPDSDDDVDDQNEGNLLPSRNRIGFCQACRFVCEGLSLMCDSCSCDFYLHVTCFVLPLSGKHTTHRHNLSLTYSYKEDPRALEFICDTCEKSRVPNRWVYCCPEPKCDVLSHLECVFPDIYTAYAHNKL